NHALSSLTRSGHATLRARLAGSLTLHDISADGRALIGRETFRIGTLGFSSGAERERELTWLDWSIARDLSPDGRTLLFVEEGEGGVVGYSVFRRVLTGSTQIIRDVDADDC